MPKKTKTRNQTLTSVIAVLAGLLYCSWPLGSWLNPVIAKNSLASGLEAPHQPYSWVFVGLDVLSSLLIAAVALHFYLTTPAKKTSARVRFFLFCICVFAIGTAIDALSPENCIPGAQHCVSVTHNLSLLFHGSFSIGASLFLFASLCIAWYHHPKNLLFSTLLAGYIIFGIISLFEAVMPGVNGNWSQHYYITLCSAWLALIPYSFMILKQPAQVRALKIATRSADRQ